MKMGKTLEKILGFCKRWKKTLIAGGAALAVLAGSAGYGWKNIYHACCKYSWNQYKTQRDKVDIEKNDLEVRVDESSQNVYVKSLIELNNKGEDISLTLGHGFKIDYAEINSQETTARRDLLNSRIVTLNNQQEGLCKVVLHYHGRIQDKFIERAGVHRDFNELSPLSGWYISDFDSFPSYRISVTVPTDHIAIAPGNLVSVAEKGDNRVFTYETCRVMNPTVITGKFEQESRKIGDVTINLYYSTYDKRRIGRLFEQSSKIIDLYSRLFGNLGNSTYTFVELPDDAGKNYNCGSMVVFKKGDGWTLPLLSHEIAHYWWGGEVKYVRSESEFNESLAEFCRLVAAEKLQSKKWFEHELAQMESIFYNYPELPDICETTGYDDYSSHVFRFKGPFAIQKLREEMGEETFFKGLKDYFRQEKHKISSVKRFQEVMQENSEKDLSKFFEKYFGKK
jgi:hypothetical protein